jgi:maltose alpha-D-glucosyltransferase / alpha-amylase
MPSTRSNGAREDSTASKLANIVIAQQREIELLRARLAELGPHGTSVVEPRAEVSPRSAQGKSTLQDENHCTEMKANSVLDANDMEMTRIVGVLSEAMEDRAIDLSFDALVKGLTTREDVRNIQKICQAINSDTWDRIFSAFFNAVVVSVNARAPYLVARDKVLAEDWFHEPWYHAYVQYTGTLDAATQGSFDTLTAMIPYFQDLGFRNICLLPHYESPMGDGGYDISDYVPRHELGGSEAYTRFMQAASAAGIRVATDAVFNHTSTEHRWFQAALNGDEKYIGYYLQRNGREKIEEWDRDGDVVCKYRDPDGTVSERVCIFPDLDRTHGLWAEINGKTYQFYREFYPFQIDLNLQNPDVIEELFAIIGAEVNEGVLGKRFDAVAHWIKKPGTASEGLPEAHALQALLKAFIRHVSPRAIVIPEVVRSLDTVAAYAGSEVSINGLKCSSQGDALLSFEMQASLREMMYFQTVAPFWLRVFRTPQLPGSCVWLNLLEHHDETYLGFFAAEVRHWIRDYITSHHGVVYKNGMSAGSRFSDCLDREPARIATAVFALYMTPGVPLIYAGLEIGLGYNHDHAKRAAAESLEKFQTLGVFVSPDACQDPRELQRGPIPLKLYRDAVSTEYLPVQTVRRLNELRRVRGALRSSAIYPLDSGDIGILCLTRRWEGEKCLLCVANLTPFSKEAIMPAGQISQRLSLGSDGDNHDILMLDILTGEEITAYRKQSDYILTMPAFDRRILEVLSYTTAVT